MPAQEPTTALFALSLLALTLISAILGAWAWAIGRLATGRALLPPPPLRVVPWRGKHVVGMVLLFLGIQLVLSPLILAIAGVRPGRDAGGEVGPGLKVLVSMISNMAFLAVGPWLLVRWARAGAADFGRERGKVGPDLGRGVVAYLLLAPIVYGVFGLATRVWENHDHPIKQMVEENPSQRTWVMVGISAAILAPLVEEFLFRGVLLGALGRWALGVDRPKPAPMIDPGTGTPGVWFEAEPAPAAGWERRLVAANVAASLIFAAMHAPAWPSPIPLFFLSLGLGALYQRTGGLAAPVALHATFNGLSTLVFYLSLQVNPDAFKDPKHAVPTPPEASRVRPDVDGTRHPRPIGDET